MTHALHSVPFVDLGRQHALIADELRAAVDRVLASGAFILGEEVERFEQAFAEYCGARFCVGVASGTAALALLVRAAGIGAGDEVIVPGHTFIASVLGVLHAQASPVLCDVEDGTGLIDVESAAALVGPRTAAILPVHLYGQICDMTAVNALARRHGLLVLEDAAQAHGAEHDGRRAPVGSQGAAYSFYPSKNLGALGDGGAICTDDAELAERARRLRNLGQRRKGEHLECGYNERLDGLQAAILRAKLPLLTSSNERRRAHAATYRAHLPPSARLLHERPGAPCTYHLFPIRVRDRDRVVGELSARGIGCGVHYSPAIHRQPLWRGSPPRCGQLVFADAWAAEEISLPMFAELETVEVERVVQVCNEILVDVHRGDEGQPSNNEAQRRYP